MQMRKSEHSRVTAYRAGKLSISNKHIKAKQQSESNFNIKCKQSSSNNGISFISYLIIRRNTTYLENVTGSFE